MNNIRILPCGIGGAAATPVLIAISTLIEIII